MLLICSRKSIDLNGEVEGGAFTKIEMKEKKGYISLYPMVTGNIKIRRINEAKGSVGSYSYKNQETSSSRSEPRRQSQNSERPGNSNKINR
jgi:hypothetical protein